MYIDFSRVYNDLRDLPEYEHFMVMHDLGPEFNLDLTIKINDITTIPNYSALFKPWYCKYLQWFK